MKTYKEKFSERLLAIENEKKEYREKLNDLVEKEIQNRQLSYSSMKAFQKSPQHFVEYLFGEKKEKTPALILGSLFDIMLLTPERFEDAIAIMPEINRRTKAGKEEYESFLEASEGKLVVDEEMIETANKMIDSFLRNDDAMYYFERMKFKQVKVEWIDHATKLKCKGYYDGESDIEDPDYFISDIKTAADADEDEFIRSAYKFGYHLQTGAYTSAAKQRYFKFPDFIHIVIEKSEPFAVNVFRASKEYIAQSQENWHNTLKAFKYCRDNRLWHLGHEFHRLGLKYNQMNLPGYHKLKFGELHFENEEI